MDQPQTDISDRLEMLTELSLALSSNRNIPLLLERILQTAKTITLADGGTLYRTEEGADGAESLAFYISINDSLNMHQGGSSDQKITIPNLPLRNEDGTPNLSAVAAYAANTRHSVNIADVYQADEFNFSGMRQFDKKYGYHSTSFLTVPMQDHEGELIGVLQLVNAINPATGQPHPFSVTDQKFIEALASQAAIAITNQQLIYRLETLFEHFIKLINMGIDEKSAHTGRHCEQVPELAMMLAEATHETVSGPMAAFTMSERDRRELWVAGLLHDCGKITTPNHVVEKSTKLETIYDRIHLVDARFEVLKRDAEIRMLKKQYASGVSFDAAQVAEMARQLQQEIAEIDADRDFLRKSNLGSEGMKPESQQRVAEIAKRQWVGPEGVQGNVLSEDEAMNLSIRAGTLNEEERLIINNHIVVTIKMLESLPWPKQLKQVPEYAGGHHERMDGKGYPRGLRGDQMSVPARVMAIADIFEALTAMDRPYKRGNTLSEALEILGGFRQRDHIDPDLFDVFVRSKVYQQYADRFMSPHQIDAVDHSKIPGYVQ
ncbi:HD domain-containing phosphohydrolase [Herbaspirillum sp. RTI4]|uniref:HD domain-containing phosphohydrolase n=1 Tax=Herbaspirillum sp. RTI4 TaxID=3048640 RepID=UPI002AB53412|nr:HD domain-containing phosphohydrolase [Herbaspirillum sp. RTI4]MDY7578474.1 HD domain-containing phosphohydrolase [Herbaspirillum sp. RTI4]MEA9981497.1 HD domain-containing phosphohydrolase [Herbaspirillum sp. RTI4]